MSEVIVGEAPVKKPVSVWPEVDDLVKSAFDNPGTWVSIQKAVSTNSVGTFVRNALYRHADIQTRIEGSRVFMRVGAHHENH